MLLDYGKHYFLGAFRIVNTQEDKSAVPQAKRRRVKNKKKGSNKSGQAQRKRRKQTNK